MLQDDQIYQEPLPWPELFDGFINVVHGSLLIFFQSKDDCTLLTEVVS